MDKADAAFEALHELFSSPKALRHAHLRCGMDGPGALDIEFETALDEVCGFDANSDYKCFVRRLYRLGLIPSVPLEWQTKEPLD